MSCFPVSRPLLVYVAAVFSLMLSSDAQCAEWPACEKAKLRQLQLQQPAHKKTSKKKHSGNTSSHRQREEEIDTWLWKNCREYSYELRQLEQERM